MSRIALLLACIAVSIVTSEAVAADCKNIYKTPCSNTDTSVGMTCSQWNEERHSCQEQEREQRQRERDARERKKLEYKAVEKVLRGQEELDKLNRGGPPK